MPSNDMRKSLEERTSHYEAQYPGSPAEAYLTSRGLSKVAQDFRLGWVGDALLTDEDYSGRLAIPYLTPAGVVSMRFKSIDGRGAKMLVDAGSGTWLYNPFALRNRDVYVTEGEPDTWSVTAVGGAALGLPGVDSWNPQTEKPFVRALRWRRVTVLAQSDDDGQSVKWAKQIARAVEGSRILKLPTGHDVNSFLQEEGESALRKYIGLDE